MKTSNIILLGLIIFIFAVPMLLIAALNSKISNKEFTLVKNEYEERKPMLREGTIGDYSVIKLEGPEPDFLECHIDQADSAGFRYEKYDEKDSIAVYTKNDTLFVQYMVPDDSAGTKKVKLGNKLDISLKIKSLSSIIIDGAEVQIDSLDTKDGFKLMLKNNGKISDVKKHDDHTLHVVKPSVDVVAELEPAKQIIEVVEKFRNSRETEMKDLLIFHLM